MCNHFGIVSRKTTGTLIQFYSPKNLPLILMQFPINKMYSVCIGIL